MSFEISNGLNLICNEISKRIETDQQFNEYDFMELLRCLSAIERFLVAKYFCKLQWNIGSLRMLGILQKLRILTATEFILSQQDIEKLQLILNDFLEDEYELITNLCTTAHYDTSNAIKLTTILDECFCRLYKDLLENSNLNNLDYLKTTTKLLPANVLTKLTQKHIQIMLELHSSNTKEAFQQFSTWINEGVDDLKCTKDLYTNLLSMSDQDALAYLFKLSQMEHFKEWKFYLILLQTIASKCAAESGAYIRKYLKTRLRQIAVQPTQSSMLHLLLTTRAATATTMDINKNIDAYAIWFKQNIGEMKFVLKSDEFQSVLTLLEQCISYEMEVDYLEIHAIISISPPVLCGKLVQSYKSKCKFRLSQIKSNAKPLQPNESILIEDSN